MTLHLRSFTFLCAADKENLLLHAGKRSNQSKSDKTYVKILWKSDLDLNVPLQLAWSTTTHKPTSAKTMKSRIPMHAQTVPIPTIILPYKCILLIPDTWLELAEVSASGVKSVNCAGGKWYMYLLICIRQVITGRIRLVNGQPISQQLKVWKPGTHTDCSSLFVLTAFNYKHKPDACLLLCCQPGKWH